jgi:2-oxo-4-hydroxy-4-carboxy-5-ureidoimidazoline decarboxylase
MNLARLNNLNQQTAQVEFLRCCGSLQWAQAMSARRPFQDEAQLFAAAEEIWRQLPPEEWREAFSHHPKIGDLDSLRQRFAATRQWSEGEQTGMQGATEETLAALAAGNAAYEKKFGYIFIVCATGKSADEMLAILQHRLPHAPAVEIKIAAEEQNMITKIRLEKLLHTDQTHRASGT